MEPAEGIDGFRQSLEEGRRNYRKTVHNAALLFLKHIEATATTETAEEMYKYLHEVAKKALLDFDDLEEEDKELEEALIRAFVALTKTYVGLKAEIVQLYTLNLRSFRFLQCASLDNAVVASATRPSHWQKDEETRKFITELKEHPLKEEMQRFDVFKMAEYLLLNIKGGREWLPVLRDLHQPPKRKTAGENSSPKRAAVE